MKIKDVYSAIIEIGKLNDPRGKKGVDDQLKQIKKSHGSLTDKEKKYFDDDTLFNPYSDSRILNGDPNAEVTGVIAGIDLEGPEILLADRLNDKGAKLNLCISHHPEGVALAGLPEVMKMQADIWATVGVPINLGDIIIDKRAGEILKNLNPVNHNRPVDFARLLGFGLMTCHSPADNCVMTFLQNLIDKEDPRTLNDIVEILTGIPEYESAKKLKCGPNVLIGDGKRRTGRIHVDMTGGTEGPKDMIENLVKAGVGTLVGMHMSEGMRAKATENNMNVVIAGHVSSDNLGFNLMFDALEAKGLPKVVTCGGFNRVERNKPAKSKAKTKTPSAKKSK